MVKGSVVLKRKKSRYWSSIFEAWWASEHPVLIVHCTDHEQAIKAKRSAYRFKEIKLEPGYVHFTCSVNENDLYVTKIMPTKYAMEVQQTEEGVLYYYDTSALI